MSRKHYTSAGVAALLAVMMLVAFTLGAHMRTVHTYIGQNIVEFKKNNKVTFSSRDWDETPYIFPESDLSRERFHVIYGKPGEEVHFPPARLVWVNQYAASLPMFC